MRDCDIYDHILCMTVILDSSEREM